MDLKYLTIGIKNCEFDEVKAVLNQLALYNSIKQIKQFIKVDITVEDLREDFSKMSNFLKEHNLKDDNPFFNDFDIDPYGLKIDFNILPTSPFVDIVELMAFILAQQMSLKLQASCIVMFENMKVPIGLFSKGVLIDEFEKYNSSFFANKVWRPNKI